MRQKTGSYKETFSKNTFYRFLNGKKTNWLRFTTLLSKAVADTIEPLTDKNRVNAFVVDDSLFERTSCKKTELGSRVFDHTTMRYTKGYRLMTLGWTDGNTFLPVNGCLLASSKASNLIGPHEHFDGRSLAAHRRNLAQMKGTDAMLELIKAAQKAGHSADYVLFDSWFSNPAQLDAIRNLGLNSIAMIKKSSRIRYEYDGQQLSIKKIFGICKKRRGRSKYLFRWTSWSAKIRRFRPKSFAFATRGTRRTGSLSSVPTRTFQKKRSFESMGNAGRLKSSSKLAKHICISSANATAFRMML